MILFFLLKLQIFFASTIELVFKISLRCFLSFKIKKEPKSSPNSFLNILSSLLCKLDTFLSFLNAPNWTLIRFIFSFWFLVIFFFIKFSSLISFLLSVFSNFSDILSLSVSLLLLSWAWFWSSFIVVGSFSLIIKVFSDWTSTFKFSVSGKIG